MLQSLLGTGLYVASFLLSLLLILLLLQVKNARSTGPLLAGTALVSLWLLLEALIHLVREPQVAQALYLARFPEMILIPPLYLLMIAEHHMGWRWNRGAKAALFVVPALSLLSLATNRVPYAFLSNLQLSYRNGMPISSFQPQLGFLVFLVYSYAAILFLGILLARRALLSPRLYRRQNLFLCFGTLASLGANVFILFLRPDDGTPDPTSISMLMTLYVLYWGFYRLPKIAMVPLARDLLVENLRDASLILDGEDRIIDINPAARQLLADLLPVGVKAPLSPEKNLTGVSLSALIQAIPMLEQIQLTGPTQDVATFAIGGTQRYYRVHLSPIHDGDHSVIGRLVLLSDITQQQEYTNSLRLLNEKLLLSDQAINSTKEGIVITDAKANILRFNDAFLLMSGFEEQDIVGQNPRLLKSDRHTPEFYRDMWNKLIHEGYWEGEIWDRKKNGETYPKWMSITSVSDNDGIVQNYIAVSMDITKIKKTEEELHTLSNFDPLTGLPNRSSFYENAREALLRAQDSGKGVALLFLDLDGFMVINDTMGHAAGDALLQKVASRIKTIVCSSDNVARFGGDEFILLLEDIQRHEDAIPMAQALISGLAQPFHIHGREVALGASIGIVMAPYDDTTIEGLIRKADAALYHAKESGKGRYSFSSEEIEQRNHDTLDIQIKLQKALEKQEFRLYLQPQVQHVKGKYVITGAEALIRWLPSDGSFITPDRFIPVSESNGMIVPIGNWVLEEIFRIDRELKANGIDIKLSINVSAKQFEGNNLVEHIGELYAANPDQNIQLVVEITESLLLQNLDSAIEGLLAVKALGVGISLDDFGTGFSSLNYLTRLPIDYLKIDKSFVDGVASHGKNLTPHIISMAKTLNLRTVAEGVETWEQVRRLTAENCDELQGYYFGKPLPLEDFIALLQARSA